LNDSLFQSCLLFEANNDGDDGGDGDDDDDNGYDSESVSFAVLAMSVRSINF
jgi:hypothetical protein